MPPERKLRFSKSAIANLPLPEGGRTTYYDTEVAGLLLRVSPSGNKSFGYFRRIKGGEPIRDTFGKFPDISVEQVRNLATQRNAEIASGKNLNEIKRALRAEPTAEQLFVEYGGRHGQSKASWCADQQRWRDYLAPVIGKRKLSKITREDIANAIFLNKPPGNFS